MSVQLSTQISSQLTRAAVMKHGDVSEATADAIISEYGSDVSVAQLQNVVSKIDMYEDMIVIFKRRYGSARALYHAHPYADLYRFYIESLNMWTFSCANPFARRVAKATSPPSRVYRVYLESYVQELTFIAMPVDREIISAALDAIDTPMRIITDNNRDYYHSIAKYENYNDTTVDFDELKTLLPRDTIWRSDELATTAKGELIYGTLVGHSNNMAQLSESCEPPPIQFDD